jgi:hypothetical protein
MKRCIFSTLLSITLLMPACGSPILQTELGKEIILSPGQAVSIADEDLHVKFTGVIGDSRCPQGVYCVWAGEVICEVEITYAGATRQTKLTAPGLIEGYATAPFEGYELAFHVTPYPDVHQDRIASGEYRLHLVVTRPPQLTSVVGYILARPTDFSGKEVTIVGYYRGWDLLQEAAAPPPVTRSDWVIKDLSGAMYVSAASKAKMPEGLQPASLESIHKLLEVKGTVMVTASGQPYIEAISIKRLPGHGGDAD